MTALATFKPQGTNKPIGTSGLRMSYRLGMATALDDILIDVAAGNPAGIDACVERFSRPIWNLARKYLNNDHDADDAVQDIFVELWNCASRFDPEFGSAMTFVMTLARRRLIDRIRKTGRRPKFENESELQNVSETTESDTLEIQDEMEKVSDAMLQLKSDQREVLELSLVHGRSHQQIALSTGLALGTVKSHARRGLMRVRELLGVSTDPNKGPA